MLGIMSKRDDVVLKGELKSLIKRLIVVEQKESRGDVEKML